jgi:hypothetical protein
MLMDLNLFRAMKQEQQVNRADRADLFSSGYASTAPGGTEHETGLSLRTISEPIR